MARIFISREVKDNPLWINLCKDAGHSVIGYSCIETISEPFEYNTPADWIFFSSSEGVHHFIKQKPKISARIAAMGMGTAQTLKQYNYEAEFIGQSANPEKVAFDFQDNISSGQTILFPQSKQTRNSIAPHLKNCNIQRLTVYSTESKMVMPTDADLYIFSSPSNVDSYFNQHPIDLSKPMIAFGPATEARIKEKGCQNILALKNVSSEEIFHAIKVSLLGLEG